MAKLYNLARMTTATTGTGTLTLGSAVPGFLTFAQSGVANGETISYTIRDGNNTEIGTGVYTSAGTTLTRNVTKSTNSDSLISLSGNAEVYISPRKEDILNTGDLGSGVQTFLGTPSSANLAAAITDETGSGALVFANSPTLVTPALGTPASGSLANCTGYTIANLVATTTNDNASAGDLGEYVESEVGFGSAISLTNATPANVTSISLSAGDWDVWGQIDISPTGTCTLALGWVSTTSATVPNAPNGGSYVTTDSNPVAGLFASTGVRRYSLSGTTTVYLSADAIFSTGTTVAYGGIYARRVR